MLQEDRVTRLEFDCVRTIGRSETTKLCDTGWRLLQEPEFLKPSTVKTP